MTALLDDPSMLFLCVVTFAIAGTVKGALGIGLPTTAMALLTLVMEPTRAMAVLVLPIIATNVQQYLTTPHRRETAREYRYVALTLVVTIFITALLVNRAPDAFLVIAIGIVMCLFSIHGLSGLRLPMGGSPAWQAAVGVAAGVCGGLSAIWSPPVAMYLLSRNVSKDRFVSGCGFLFLVGSLPLGAGLFLAGVIDGDALALSLVSLVVVLAAFRVGAALRARLANETFRKLVLVAFMLLGLRLVLTGLAG